MGGNTLRKSDIVARVNYGTLLVDVLEHNRIIFADAGFYAITGYTLQDVEKQQLCFQDLFVKEDFPIYAKELSAILAVQDTAYLEHRLQRKDGSVTYVFCFGKQRRDENGKLVGEITLTDISHIKRLQAKFNETEMELEALIQNLPGSVSIVEIKETAMHLLHATEDYFHQFGYTREEYMETSNGGILGKLFYPQDLPILNQHIAAIARGEKTIFMQVRVIRKDQSLMWVDVRGQFLRIQNGNPLFYLATFDITKAKQRDEELRLQTERYQLIAEHTDELFYDYDVKHDTMNLPQNFLPVRQGKIPAAIPGYLERSIPKKVVHPEDYPRFLRELMSCLTEEKKTSIEVRMRMPGAEDYEWYRLVCVCSANEQGEIVRLFGRQTSVDNLRRLKKTVSEDKRIIERLSTTDPVTGLLNRVAFKERSALYLEEADTNACYAFVYSDFNDFSYVNDNFGYDSGNTMLYEFGSIISSSPATVFGSRINSDYFLCLMKTDTRDELERLVRERDALFVQRQRKKYPASEIQVATGISFIDPRHFEVTEEMDNANLARRKAKTGKDDLCCIYYEALRTARAKEKTIAAELHGAIASHTVELFLQPKFMMDDLRIIGAEALVRWRNPDGTYRMPSEFIDILEKVGYIVELDFFMYEEVLRSLRQWQDNGMPLVPISVNFSRLHNNYPNFVDRVISLAKKYRIDSCYIEVEVTESAFASDAEQMERNMRRLQEAGFSIDIDDFGKGYSSLSLLMGSPIDVVKVDKAFVDSIEVSEKHREYIKRMCMLIQATEKEIIFEGVENRKQADFLCACGFKKAQGWLLDKAVPVSVFEQKYVGNSLR